MTHLDRCELWSDVEAGGGQRVAVLRHLLSLTEQVRLDGEHTVRLRTAFDHPAVRTLDTPAGLTNFRIGMVVRLVRGTKWSEHRVTEAQRTVTETDRTRTLTARSVMLDLGTTGICEQYEGHDLSAFQTGRRTATFTKLGLTAHEHFTQYIYPALVAGGQPWWEWLDLEPDLENRPIDLVYDNDTPLSAFRKIADALGGLELAVLPDAERYTVVLKRRLGDGADPVVALAKRTLLGTTYSESMTDQATRIYPTGAAGGVKTWVRDMAGRAEDVEARAALHEAEWRLSGAEPRRYQDPAYPGIDFIAITLVDEAGGPGPIAFEHQFGAVPREAPTTTPYSVIWVTAVHQEDIWTTLPTTQEVVFAVAPGATVPFQRWHRVRIVAKTEGGEADTMGLTYTEHPEAVEDYDVIVGTMEVPNVPPTTNLIRNPIVRLWDANDVMPREWSKAAAMPDANIGRGGNPSDEAVTAGKSIRAIMTAPGHVVYSPWSLLPYQPRGLLSFFVRWKVVLGRVKAILWFCPVEVDSNTGEVTFLSAEQVVIPDDIAVTEPEFPDALRNTARELWQDMGIAAAYEIPDTTQYAAVQVQVMPSDQVTGTQNNNVLIDAVQVTLTPEQRPLLDGNGGVRLWQAANDRLARYAQPALTVSANLLDVAHIDPVAYPYDAFVLGGEVRLIDPDAEVDVSTRITGWERDWLNQVNTRVDISNSPDDLTRAIAQPQTTVARGR